MNPYLAILRLPGALRFSFAGAIARLPMSMVGLAIVLIIEQTYSSYAAGGRVSAMYLVASAIAVPLVARLIDRHGQGRVMTPLTAANGVFLLGLGGAIVAGLPEPVLWVLAAGVGATSGAFGALVRARWTAAVSTPRQLHTAFSLESAIDEFIFVVGPTLATILVVQVWPLAGLALPAIAVVGGGLWFCSQRSSEPPAKLQDQRAGAAASSVIRNPRLIALSAVFLFVGIVFGSTEVSTVAFAKEQGHESMAGIVLGVFALGSMLAGLGYGARHWRSSLVRRLIVTLAILSAGMVSLLFVQNLWQLAAVLALGGVSIAPTLITGNSIVHQIVGSDHLTEGLAWASTAMTIGVSTGTAIAGMLIDHRGAHAGYALSGGGALAALATAAVVGLAVRARAPRPDSGTHEA
ncbi:putative MFS family arabinose efflux permease [Rarobacter incanus]|uniref:Putative MFS family arabinose efflux permease n=1 Tax=Rarobacter incanus TaxID=153494 RepID=A0A542SPN6_9MICO|nr:putative MFS family arabinose efflux permease [Rarobacter incanus]